MITRRKVLAGIAATPVALAGAVAFTPNVLGYVTSVTVTNSGSGYRAPTWDDDDLLGTVERIMKQYVFEFNDDVTRNWIKTDICHFFNHLQNTGQIHKYSVVCDMTNNKSNVGDGIVIASIYYSPSRSAVFKIIRAAVKSRNI